MCLSGGIGSSMVADSTPKKVLLVHGWDDDPTSGWLDWLQQELTAQGYLTIAPHFQTKPKPDLVHWMKQLQRAAALLPDDGIIVAHSLGCWLSLRLLEAYPADRRLRRLICVSGFSDAPNDRAQSYFTPAPDWSHIKQVVHERICVYSDDDRIVTPDRTRRLAHQLEARLICLPGQGHFLGSRGMDSFPELLEIVTAA